MDKSKINSHQILLQPLSLPLPHAKKVIQLWRFNLVGRELFSEQPGELGERGNVSVGDPIEPLKVPINILHQMAFVPPKMAFRVLYLREKGHLGWDIARWHNLIHDCL